MIDLTQPETVTTAIEEIKTRLNTVPVIQQKIVHIYNANDLQDVKKELLTPCIGVVYMGVRGKEDSSQTGGQCTLYIDLYMLGGDSCNAKIDGKLVDSLYILACMRGVLAGKCVEAPQAKHKWKFSYELPTEVCNQIGYVQRWTTSVNILKGVL